MRTRGRYYPGKEPSSLKAFDLNEKIIDELVSEVEKTDQFKSLKAEQKKFWSEKNIVFMANIDNDARSSKCAYFVAVYSDIGPYLNLRQGFLVDKEHRSISLRNLDGEYD